MPKVRRRVARTMTGWCARLFLRATAVMPFSICYRVAQLVALAAWVAVPRIRRVGLENLELAYGDAMPSEERKRVLWGALLNATTVAAEFSHLAKLDDAMLCDRVELRGSEHLEGRGCVIVGAHFGNWEWMAPALYAHGFPTGEVVRPLDDPGLNQAVDRLRRAHGVETIEKAAAGGQIFRLLREGTHVGILVDQSPRENAVPVTFFGTPCWATIAPAMVAFRSKAPIVFATMLRKMGGRYLMEIHPPLEIQRTGNLREDLVRITQECQDRLEAAIREHPDQWLWLHRRWKERPRLVAEWEARQRRDSAESN